MEALLKANIGELRQVLVAVEGLGGALARLGTALLACWEQRGKALVAGNGGSAADAMHLAEELVVRFAKDRRALGAIALTDPTIITCCSNDYSYERIFSRQVEALGQENDVLIILSTSGNSVNLIRAIDSAKERKMVTVSFLGKGGGKTKGLCDIELIVPSDSTARIQEAHKLLFHTLCEWVDEEVEKSQ